MGKKIEITKKMHPFSHLPGKEFVLAGSHLSIKFFPCCFEIRDLSDLKRKKKTFSLFLQGPVKKFTIIQDIEKERIECFGRFDKDHVRYELSFENDDLVFSLKKGPKKNIIASWEGDEISLKAKKSKLSLISDARKAPKKKVLEKLSLGMHKSLDWDLVLRRMDLKEILPIWFLLGQSIPYQKPFTDRGNGYFIDETKKLITDSNRKDVETLFLSFFQSAFSGVIIPSVIDMNHQGLIPKEFLDKVIDEKDPSLFLLHEGACLIRSLFIAQEKNMLSILPCLPVSFHSGRMINIQIEEIGELDVEWSKKLLRRMEIRVKEDAEISLNLQKPIKSFRVKCSNKDRGSLFSIDDSLSLEKGKVYRFDRFQK